jgi:hypothetical protein
MTTHNTQEDADHRHGCQDRLESQGLATPGDGDTAEGASGDEPDAYQEGVGGADVKQRPPRLDPPQRVGLILRAALRRHHDVSRR